MGLAELRQPRALSCWPDALLIAYYAPAELGCFLALGWQMPVAVLDLFASSALANGRDGARHQGRFSLLAALGHFVTARTLKKKPAGAFSATGARIRTPFSTTARRTPSPWHVAAGTRQPAPRARIGLSALLPGAATCAPSRPWSIGARRLIVRCWGACRAPGEPLRMEKPLMPFVPLPDFDRDMLRDREKLSDGWSAKTIPWPRTETGRLGLSGHFPHDGARYPIVAPIRECAFARQVAAHRSGDRP